MTAKKEKKKQFLLANYNFERHKVKASFSASAVSKRLVIGEHNNQATAATGKTNNAVAIAGAAAGSLPSLESVRLTRGPFQSICAVTCRARDIVESFRK